MISELRQKIVLSAAGFELGDDILTEKSFWLYIKNMELESNYNFWLKDDYHFYLEASSDLDFFNISSSTSFSTIWIGCLK